MPIKNILVLAKLIMSMLSRRLKLLTSVPAGTTTRSGSASIDASKHDICEVRPFNEIPGPKGLPYLGTLFQYRYGVFKKETYNDALLAHHRQYGNIFKETIAGRTKVHLFDPDYVSAMYKSEGKLPHVPPLLETSQIYRKLRDMSPGLGNTNGEDWYQLRHAVQQKMMKPKAANMYLPQVNEVMDDFMKRLDQIRDPDSGRVPDFTNELRKWNHESSAMKCFEKRLGCFSAEKDSLQQRMLDANNKMFELACKLSFSVPWYKLFQTPTRRRLMAAEDLLFQNGQKLVDDAVGEIRRLVEAGNLEEGRYSLLTYLMAREELSYKDLSIITLSLFNDGLNTTVPSLIGQIYCLAANPEKQQKLYESICEVAPDENQPITSEMINRLPYLKACIKEGFRFFPISVEVSRIVQKDLVIGGYHIPAGTHVQLNNNMLLSLPEYFSEPEEYRPERWVRGGTAENVHPYLLLPFGFGPRICVGRRFAEQEMQLMLIRLLQKFQISWPHSQKMRQRYCMLLNPDLPPRFKFVPRM